MWIYSRYLYKCTSEDQYLLIFHHVRADSKYVRSNSYPLLYGLCWSIIYISYPVNLVNSCYLLGYKTNNKCWQKVFALKSWPVAATGPLHFCCPTGRNYLWHRNIFSYLVDLLGVAKRAVRACCSELNLSFAFSASRTK